MKKVGAGFTLIELAIVVAIISILAAIALPVLAKNQARAAESACLSEMKSYVSLSVAAEVSGESIQSAPRRACGSADDFVLSSAVLVGTPRPPGIRRSICTTRNANCALEL